ncbi:MAG: hypothetical protein ACR2H6_01980 [Pyrinomonadaceae bacterium]
MKRCPQCLEAYADEEKFCEIDGKKLLGDPFHVVGASPVAAPARKHSEQSLMVLVGVLGGVVISAALFVVYSVARNEPQSSQLSARVPQTVTTTGPSRPNYLEPAPRATATPLEESESVDAAPEAETQEEAQSTPVSTRVNQGPITTSSNKDESKMRTIIELNDGTSLDVDAAWKEGQGIWYRRGGLVSFLDSKDVKSISTVADAKKADGAAKADSH